MNKQELLALMPLIVLSVTAVVLMLQIAFRRNHFAAWVIALVGLTGALLSTVWPCVTAPLQVTPLLNIDRYGLFFAALMLLVALAMTLLSYGYLKNRPGRNEDYYLLLLLAALGAVVLCFADHVGSFLLGLELLGVSLYALIAYPHRQPVPVEAAIKYLVLSGSASAILLFGFALFYAATGTLSFVDFGVGLTYQGAAGNIVLIVAGSALVLAGIAFKLSLAPFHMWTPDVYQGAPLPVTALLATISKGAIFVALLRLFIEARLYQYAGLLSAMGVLAVASMLVGNLLALRQDNLKRLLAYSSIAHFGYLLVAMVAGGVLGGASLASESAGYYLVAYVLTTLAAFAVLGLLSESGEGERDALADMEGLFWRHPLLATVLTVALLSLAGIPLTAGFIGKFYLFVAGITGALWWLLGALVLGSAIGIYYYLRVVFAMTRPDIVLNQEKIGETPIMGTIIHSKGVCGRGVALVLVVLVIWLGVYPQPVMEYLRGLL